MSLEVFGPPFRRRPMAPQIRSRAPISTARGRYRANFQRHECAREPLTMTMSQPNESDRLILKRLGPKALLLLALLASAPVAAQTAPLRDIAADIARLIEAYPERL